MENFIELIGALTGTAIVTCVYYRIYKNESNRE